MPELPEVEVVRSGLAPALVGGTITSVEVLEPRSLKRHDAHLGAFESLVTGARPLAVARRGKFLWVPISDQFAIVGHLGMSGQMLLRTPGFAEDGLLRVRFTLDHPEHGELWWHFVDQRIFGSVAVDRLVDVSDEADAGFFGRSPGLGAWRRRIPSQVAHIARDPLDPAFDDDAWIRAVRRKRVGIKRVLLDQNLMSGVGNIYADESLWRSGLHYERIAEAVSVAKLRGLLGDVRDVLAQALVEGGTSFDAQYVNVNGNSGYFSHSLNAYGQQGKPCPRCGTEIRRESFMNRGSHFCPRCQRKR
ncbi:MAG TPA: bifunctional DNA-formamidopyrimidine glycosylase/DNA-(apurinic or apyrimidinic site) lyase [Microbacteriaceae bacterium]|nr:bifunctional DNA-formamidopyrimidine glycosylase/DNA-(apurinic or apyrimidinic site) lyase [Microbacteriaceae bacterium]